MKDKRERAGERWLANPAHQGEAELREALDQAAAREADEVALRRVWARLAEMPALVPSADTGDDRRGALDHALGREAPMSRVRWPWIVAASLAGATATLAFMLIETKSEFRAERGGQPEFARPSGTTEAGGVDAGQRSTLVAPATVRTGFGETLHLALRGGTEVVLTSESTLVLDRNDRAAVSAGEVQFHVPHQPAGQTFAVTAGNYRVVVVGTRFRVRVNPASPMAAAVSVDEGIVEIWTDHRIARVTAGQSWVSPDGTPQRTTAAADTPGDSGTSNARPGSPSVNQNGTQPHLAASPSTTVATGPSNAVPKGPRQKMLALAAPSAPAPFSAVAPAESAESAGRGTSRFEVSVLPVAALEPVPKGPSRTPAASPDVPLLALQARAARAGGDAKRALGLYRTLAERGGAAGENAEYEIGRVLRDGLHQSREAVSVWRAYRASHPHGLLRIEADISVIETLVSLGDKTGATAEASDFIRRYPESERRSEVARLAGDLLRERGECGEAVRAYDVALARARGGQNLADAPSFHRSVCLLRGDQSQGVASLRAYLDSFPAGRFRGDAERLLSGPPSVQPAVAAPR